MPQQTSEQLLLDQLENAFDLCLTSDRHGFRRRLQGLQRRLVQGQPIDRGLERLRHDVQASMSTLQRRLNRIPALRFDDQLPINQRREEIARTVRDHQVVVICGETGSGKTTQLPKICLELGLGTAGTIGHTQPRRLAARSVASRISDELGTELGDLVGYKVRFADKTQPDTLIKLMTDGILLAETQNDPWLSHYQVLIIDEAHERSLNIDFLLGYLHRLLPQRPDLKIIITSATIDPERFSRHFGNAPIIEVSGRTYPVELRYRPLYDDDEDDDTRERDMEQGILEAVEELATLGSGDILIFLSGEREIREVADALRKRNLRHTEVVPLFARLSASEQNRVFQPHTGRRIVLATNVAETSLTVPGIKYVIDTGYARISRYSPRAKVQRLPIEKISQASANQRAGRCGRVSEGICIRLYSEEDYQARPEFTDPEILRTNLAAVILQMASLKLGEVAEFAFIDPPDGRLIRDGYQLLFELGAVDEHYALTDLGRRLAKLPIDPRLGRMILAGQRQGVLEEMLIIASALAIQDPRERPLEAQQAADEKHRRFSDAASDFVALLNLWRYYQGNAKTLSQNQLRNLCRGEFLSYVRLREWRDLYHQLRELMAEQQANVEIDTELGDAIFDDQDDFIPLDLKGERYRALHSALMSGLLGNLGLKQEAEQNYLGARNRKFYLFPGSGLFKKPPKWVMAAELVETTRLYARTCARIEPDWIEPLAEHLVKRSYSEPHWEQRPAQVAATEKVTLYGLPIVNDRRVNYGPIDPETSRALFIRHALVYGEYHSKADFIAHNQALIEEVEALEAKSRRRDVLVDEETLYRFFDARLPDAIVSGKHFERWRKQVEAENPRYLFMTKADLMAHDASEVTAERFPDHLNLNGMQLPLTYHFEPGGERDGVTLTVPLAVLNQLDARRLEWLVPGLLPDRMAALLKSLPKALRRSFVPVPNYVNALMESLPRYQGSLIEAMTARLKQITGVAIPEEAWNHEAVPKHLQMNLQVVDLNGKLLAEGRDLHGIKARLKGQAQESFAALPTPEFERAEVTDWDFGDLPEEVSLTKSGITLKGYPALVAESNNRGEQISLRLWDVKERADAAHRRGLHALIALRQRDKMKHLKRNLPHMQAMSLHYMGVGRSDDLRQDLHSAIIDRAYLGDAPLPRSRDAFLACLARGNERVMAVAQELGDVVHEALGHHHQVRKRLKGRIPLSWIEAVADIKDQLHHLVYPGFVSRTPPQWLIHLPRYLKAIEVRLDKLDQAPDKDRQRRGEIERLWRMAKGELERVHEGMAIDPELELFRWMIEELRVSQFAQELKTAMPVSIKRLESQWALVKG